MICGRIPPYASSCYWDWQCFKSPVTFTCNQMVKLCITELPGWHLLRGTYAEVQDRPLLGFLAGRSSPDGWCLDLPPSVSPRPAHDSLAGCFSNLLVSWDLCEAARSLDLYPNPAFLWGREERNGWDFPSTWNLLSLSITSLHQLS